MRHSLVVGVMVLLTAPVAGAQTKISGTLQCGKPDPQHMIAVDDRPNHSLGVEQIKCTWTKPMEIAGAQSKDGISTATVDVSGNTARARGYHVSTMENKDKFFVRYQGTVTFKDGAAQVQKGSWSFTGGTGKLKGLKGQGTYDCLASGESQNCDVEGEYQLPK